MRRRSADSGREGLNQVADSIDPQGFHIAFVNTRMPGLNTFQIRDLRTLLRLGVRIDLYLYDMNSLDSNLREEIERLGGRVERIGLPTDIRALFSCFVEVLRNPIQLLRDLALSVSTIIAAPSEGLRSLAVLPAAIELGTRLRAPHVHALWAGVPATTAFWIGRRSSRTFSVSAHAWDLLQRTCLLPRKVAASTKLVVCSTFAQRTAIDRVGDSLGERVQVIHHGLDLSSWPDRGSFRCPTTLHVIAVGRLTEKKGFSYLLEACAFLCERRLDLIVEIIGPDGGIEGALRDEVERLGLHDRVTLTGPLPGSVVRQRMRTASILCCPSIESARSSDGIPNVVLEAMALGTPVVATDAGGLSEVVIREKTGRVVPQRDSRALADELAACWQDWDVTQSHCRAARALMESEFEAESTARAFLAALDLPASSLSFDAAGHVSQAAADRVSGSRPIPRPDWRTNSSARSTSTGLENR